MTEADQGSFFPIEDLTRRLEKAKGIWLFLDYDGTLAEFAPTPADILPDQHLIQLLTTLAADPKFRITVISGRRLDQIQQLVPIPGIILAGTYGIEIQEPGGQIIQRASLKKIIPVIKKLKSLFTGLLAGLKGFFLEDKGWTVAIHARYADPGEAEQILHRARWLAVHYSPEDMFRFLDGDRFFEVSPLIANKAETVEYLLGRDPWPEAELVYLGDDDKDEEAFVAIKRHGGHAVLVASQPRASTAEYRISAPVEVKEWLEELTHLNHPTGAC